MRRLTTLGRLVRPMLKLLNASERGAVGVLVAILIGGGVLIGMGALVLDVGQLYQYRAELQNGADAGALAVATSCAQGSCAPTVATTFAKANSHTGFATVPQVCGSSGLGSCPGSTGKLTDCPSAPAGVTYVDVHTQSQTPSGSSLVPPVLAKTLLGKSSYTGTTVSACAVAEWGAPSTATSTTLTVDNCEWSAATNDGNSFATSPPYPQNPTPNKSFDQVMHLSVNSSDGCGTFNWITDSNGNCTTDLAGDYSAISVPSGVPSECVPVLSTSQTNKTVILVPVYGNGSSCGHGGSATYVLEGFAAFVVTGYHFGTKGPSASDWLNSKNDCTGSANCVNGYFTQTLVTTTQGTVGGQDMGATIVQLIG